eukprot:scaffold84590_cov41-Phaeocystis_antarctica.AAC.1
MSLARPAVVASRQSSPSGSSGRTPCRVRARARIRARARARAGVMIRGKGRGRGRGRGSLHQHRRHGRLGRLQVSVGLLARAHHPREDGKGVDVGRSGDDRRVGKELGCLCVCTRGEAIGPRVVTSRPAGGASEARVLVGLRGVLVP